MSLINSVKFNIPNGSSSKYLLQASKNDFRERIVLTPQEYDKRITSLSQFLSKKSKIEFKGKVYLGTTSNLPRHKIKEYFNINNIHKTSKLEHAGTIILDKNSIRLLYEYLIDLTESKYHNVFSKAVVYTIDKAHDKRNLIRSNMIHSPLIGLKSLSSIIEDPNIPFYITLLDSGPSTINYALKSYIGNITPQILYIDTNYSKNKNINDVYKLIQFLEKNPNINVIFDEDILPILNSEGLELNEEYLRTLDTMFESKDQNNIDLALEMLSNVDLEKYSLTLALFLNKHAGIFFRGSGLNISQNRSFKSFIQYYDSKKIKFKSSWPEFSAALLKVYKDSPKDTKIIHNFILQNINSYLRLNSYGKQLSNWVEIEDCNIKLK